MDTPAWSGNVVPLCCFCAASRWVDSVRAEREKAVRYEAVDSILRVANRCAGTPAVAGRAGATGAAGFKQECWMPRIVRATHVQPSGNERRSASLRGYASSVTRDTHRRAMIASRFERCTRDFLRITPLRVIRILAGHHHRAAPRIEAAPARSRRASPAIIPARTFANCG